VPDRVGLNQERGEVKRSQPQTHVVVSWPDHTILSAGFHDNKECSKLGYQIGPYGKVK